MTDSRGGVAFPADIDGDGQTDIVASFPNVDELFLFTGDEWSSQLIDDEIKDPDVIVVADLDADGDLDFLVANRGDVPIVWYENVLSAGNAAVQAWQLYR